MRTTVRLHDHLLRDAKQLAARTGRSLTAVIEDALREALNRNRRYLKRPPVKLPTFRGKGLRPGVDLDRTASLLDIEDPPRPVPGVRISGFAGRGQPRSGGRRRDSLDR